MSRLHGKVEPPTTGRALNVFIVPEEELCQLGLKDDGHAKVITQDTYVNVKGASLFKVLPDQWLASCCDAV